MFGTESRNLPPSGQGPKLSPAGQGARKLETPTGDAATHRQLVAAKIEQSQGPQRRQELNDIKSGKLVMSTTMPITTASSMVGPASGLTSPASVGGLTSPLGSVKETSPVTMATGNTGGITIEVKIVTVTAATEAVPATTGSKPSGPEMGSSAGGKTTASTVALAPTEAAGQPAATSPTGNGPEGAGQASSTSSPVEAEAVAPSTTTATMGATTAQAQSATSMAAPAQESAPVTDASTSIQGPETANDQLTTTAASSEQSPSSGEVIVTTTETAASASPEAMVTETTTEVMATTISEVTTAPAVTGGPANASADQSPSPVEELTTTTETANSSSISPEPIVTDTTTEVMTTVPEVTTAPAVTEMAPPATTAVPSGNGTAETGPTSPPKVVGSCGNPVVTANAVIYPTLASWKASLDRRLTGLGKDLVVNAADDQSTSSLKASCAADHDAILKTLGDVRSTASQLDSAHTFANIEFLMNSIGRKLYGIKWRTTSCGAGLVFSFHCGFKRT
ncbi:hypothetical protein HDE_09405 [Halotydeus destructor]|nr:hypothetical protein HDE_09405 [Halotydeus destructor]